MTPTSKLRYRNGPVTPEIEIFVAISMRKYLHGSMLSIFRMDLMGVTLIISSRSSMPKRSRSFWTLALRSASDKVLSELAPPPLLLLLEATNSRGYLLPEREIFSYAQCETMLIFVTNQKCFSKFRI